MQASNQPEEQYCTCDHKNYTARGAFGDALADLDASVAAVFERLAAHGCEVAIVLTAVSSQ